MAPAGTSLLTQAPAVTPENRKARIIETRVQTQTIEFLKSYPGHAFCDDCLAERLGMDARDVRCARIGLAGSTDFDQHVWFCSVCMQRTHVIHVAWLAGGTFDFTDSVDPGTA